MVAWWSTSFARSLPLFVVAGVFFTAGIAVWVVLPRYGPGVFTLWALLLTLGFVSCIGGVASWLLPADPNLEAEEPAGVAATGRRREPAASLAFVGQTRGGSEFGRPSPEIARSSPPTAVPSAVTRPVGRAARSRPVWSEEEAAQYDHESAADVLSDLEGIERELAPKRPYSPSARA